MKLCLHAVPMAKFGPISQPKHILNQVPLNPSFFLADFLASMRFKSTRSLQDIHSEKMVSTVRTKLLPPRPYRRRARWSVDSWAWEILSCILSIIATVTVAVVVFTYNEKPLPRLPYDIGVYTIHSFFIHFFFLNHTEFSS